MTSAIGGAADPDDTAIPSRPAAGATGTLCEEPAPISGAEAGCQGEVGSAASLAAALLAESVFVGSGIFKSGNPAARAAAIVKATTFHDDSDVLAKVSRGLGEAMVGINVDDIPQPHRLAERGW
jgi:pyridoxal biosynthesis lyase PdxS